MKVSNMKNYKVDVIIPVYNSLEWVKICLDAIIKNTNLDILGKIYLINDKSNDETKDYLDRMQIKWGELLEVIHNKENLGFVKTCNKGMKKSTSDYVLLLNTDCIVSKNAIEKMATAMNKDKKIIINNGLKDRLMLTKEHNLPEIKRMLFPKA